MLALTNIQLFLSLFLGSLLGSWHCAVMCGGLASYASSKGHVWPYQMGRLLSYLFLGALSGWLGQTVSTSFSKTGHVVISIGIALLLFLSLFRLWMGAWKNFDSTLKLQKFLIYRLQKLPVFFKTSWGLGLATGFLPCHWLAVYVFAAWSTKNPLTGMAVMTLFWLGNLPYLLLFQYFFKDVVNRLPMHLQKWVSTILILISLHALAIKNFF